MHNDSEPSLVFYPKTNSWYCYGCAEGGGTIELVAAVRKTDKKKALFWLLGAHGVKSPTEPHPTPINLKANPKAPARRTSTEIFTWLVRSSPIGIVGTSYLRKRGFSDAVIQHFSLAEIQDAKSTLNEAATKWSLNELRDCGLVTYASSSPRLIFRNNTILFPFFEDGIIRYIQGRIANNIDKPRWINLVGIQKPLYNIDIIESHPRSKPIYLCEGVTDVLAASQLGLRAVGILGAQSLTPEHAHRFAGLSVTLLPDGDQGGLQFESHALPLLRKANASVNVLRVPMNTDMADQIRPKWAK